MPARCTLQFVRRCYGLRGIYGRFENSIRNRIGRRIRFEIRFERKKTIRRSLISSDTFISASLFFILLQHNRHLLYALTSSSSAMSSISGLSVLKMQKCHQSIHEHNASTTTNNSNNVIDTTLSERLHTYNSTKTID